MPELTDVLVEELRDLLDAERQINRVLPSLSEIARSAELRAPLKRHLAQSQSHIDRLQSSLKILKQESATPSCRGMRGILEEVELIIGGAIGRDDLKFDLELIGVAQKIEYYEISGYRTAQCLAKLIGERKIAAELTRTLREEEAANRILGETRESLLKRANAAVPPASRAKAKKANA
jgi:Mn-containing catalase